MQCLSNLRSIGAASLLWAQENDKTLPNPTPQSNQRWHGYIVWDAPGGNRQWTGIGKLFEQGYIEDDRTFYCPTARIGEYDYDSQWQIKVHGADNVDGGFRIGYQQRVADTPLTLTDGVNHILATDLFAAEYSQHGNRSINIVYMDGHVRTETGSSRWGANITNALYVNWEKNP